MDYPRRDTYLAQRLEERCEEVIGVAAVPFRCRHLGQRMADPLTVAVVKERVNLAQRVGSVGDIDQLRLAARIAHRTRHRIGGEDFAHAADVDWPRWCYPR